MSSPAPLNNLVWQFWHEAAPYVSHPIASGAAIVPVFYGLVVKSAQQTESPTPLMSVKEALKGGLKASRALSVMMGTQMIAQTHLDLLTKGMPYASLLNSMLIGAISAPALVVFNGYSMKRSALASLKLLSLRQVAAIVYLETSFLFSMRITLTADDYMKNYLGDNRATSYVTSFISGAVGSLIGHPADTAVTRWQKELLVPIRVWYYGAPVKAVTLGAFSLIYKAMKEAVEKGA